MYLESAILLFAKRSLHINSKAKKKKKKVPLVSAPSLKHHQQGDPSHKTKLEQIGPQVSSINEYPDFVMVVSTQSQAVSTLDRVHCVDTVPGSVDTSPGLQKTQLPEWDSVSTQSQAVSTLVSVTRRTVLQKWDSVSTHSLVVSTHSG
ncbi:hypothetical protein Taro_037290 [Colocasia esculenta]|uniref:Uncharacterized protein n=1 Tax=Colocasia esculenta TaxID=4460 RepID=A0A843WKE0_COLES|nr:hypothetical protein [Colocasia esculenta]